MEHNAYYFCLVANLYLNLLQPHDCSPPGSRLWDVLGKNTGAGCHFLLHNLPIQGSNPRLLHWQTDYH